MSLRGKGVLVTRPRDQADELMRLLAGRGARAIAAPAIRLDDPPDWTPLDQALDRITEYDWVVFTSQNALPRFLERLALRGRGVEALSGARVAAIGEVTAQGLREHGVRVEAVPDEYRAEAVAELLGREELRGKRVLLPRALVAREVLPERLVARGAMVDVVPVYRTVADREGAAAGWRAIEAGEADAVTFTSSSTVTYFLEALETAERPERRDALARLTVASIGPITSNTLRQADLPPAVEARPYTVAALVEALAAHYAARDAETA